MCRLFGFRSIRPSHVRRSLVAAENALARQSGLHPDGWGVCFYVDGVPQITRSPNHALHDDVFHRVSTAVSSSTVLAHVRKATQGAPTILNSHPFQHGRWVFAHNGDIPGFRTRWRRPLIQEVAPDLRDFILGETDSEVVFFLLLTALARHGPLTRACSAQAVADSLRGAVGVVRAICDVEPGSPPLLSCIVTDGSTMVGHQGGKDLFWSTYKTRCDDRECCSQRSAACESATSTGFVQHLILSSEPVLGENVWTALGPGEIVGVDWSMKLYREQSDLRGKITPALVLPHTG